MSKILGILKKRNKLVKKFSSEEPNFFVWEDLLELDKYSTYIYITPRGIGKSHSAHNLIIDVYNNSGEWTVWMRTTDIEIKEIIDDYKRNRPDAWPEWAQVKGRSLIDDRDGALIMKFVAMSTVGNLASITGNGCFGIYYDEFLKRTGRPIAKLHTKLTDFIRTVERTNLATVMLGANMTTLDSDILNKLDLWTDKPIVDDLDRRLKFRYITEWENPPKVETISTASLWASSDKNLKDFMEKAQLLDDSDVYVLPESRAGALRHISMFLLDGSYFTLSLNDENKWFLIEGERCKGVVNVLTTIDGFKQSKNTHIRPYNLEQTMSPIIYALESKNLMFSSHELQAKMFKFIEALKGKYQRKLA